METEERLGSEWGLANCIVAGDTAQDMHAGDALHSPINGFTLFH